MAVEKLGAGSTLLEAALKAHAIGELELARRLYLIRLSEDPNCTIATLWLGTIETQSKNYEAANRHFQQLLKRGISAWELHINYANLAYETARLDEAVKHYKLALNYKPNHHVALTNLAACYNELKHERRALSCCDQAIVSAPSFADAWNNRGNALLGMGQYVEAEKSYLKALSHDAENGNIWNNLGRVKHLTKDFKEALVAFENALKLKPSFPDAWNNLANTYAEIGAYERAVLCYRSAINIDPLDLKAKANLAETYDRNNQSHDAINTLSEILAQDQHYPLALGALILTALKIADWSDYEDRKAALVSGVKEGRLVTEPFAVLAMIDDPTLQLRASKLYANHKKQRLVGSKIKKHSTKNKLRVGYFSVDFRAHPITYLVTDLIAKHDRNKFEIYGFSFAPREESMAQKKIYQNFDHLIELNSIPIEDIRKTIKDAEIDIAVDLGGYTQKSPLWLLEDRIAPIQLSYLGYIGTLGNKFIDYIIADPCVVPKESRRCYSESILYLPHCFQVNSVSQHQGGVSLSRSDAGLPEKTFVYACLNNIYKLTPNLFRCWIRILAANENSVLWIMGSNSLSKKNLSIYAEKNGLNRERLIFSDRTSRENFLSQIRLADLVLDTTPYNGGSTTIDALSVGLPVLTLKGESYVSRMGASILSAVGLEGMIAEDELEYEQIATSLAFDKSKLGGYKTIIQKARREAKIFNSLQMTKDIETGFEKIFELTKNGQNFRDVYV